MGIMIILSPDLMEMFQFSGLMDVKRDIGAITFSLLNEVLGEDLEVLTDVKVAANYCGDEFSFVVFPGDTYLMDKYSENLANNLLPARLTLSIEKYKAENPYYTLISRTGIAIKLCEN